MSTIGWKYVRRQLLFLLVILILSLLIFIGGLMIGYAILGEGKHALDILSFDKWHSLINKFTGNS